MDDTSSKHAESWKHNAHPKAELREIDIDEARRLLSKLGKADLGRMSILRPTMSITRPFRFRCLLWSVHSSARTLATTQGGVVRELRLACPEMKSSDPY